LQPVFGILMAARIRQLYREMGEPRDFTVVELGAGRREMAAAFSEWRYVPVEIDSGELPEHFRGVVFSNEFFDACRWRWPSSAKALPRAVASAFPAAASLA
jgi:SAM-dependent MidA family methyltransferase